MKKDGFLKSIPFSGMSIIELLLIIFLFSGRYLNWGSGIDVNIFFNCCSIYFCGYDLTFNLLDQIEVLFKNGNVW